MENRQVVDDKNLIAFCGLYCGACGAYLKGKCPGCRENVKATWCKLRTCCLDKSFLSCADCKEVELMECKKYNNFISKVMGFILNSNRSACIERIKVVGYENFATEMAKEKKQTIKRK
jgi:hypothetical protein